VRVCVCGCVYKIENFRTLSAPSEIASLREAISSSAAFEIFKKYLVTLSPSVSKNSVSKLKFSNEKLANFQNFENQRKSSGKSFALPKSNIPANASPQRVPINSVFENSIEKQADSKIVLDKTRKARIAEFKQA
jgi:hypothetical protein